MANEMIRVAEMTCDYKREPLGIEGRPLLRWKLDREGMQAACRVRAATSPDRLERPDLWDSGWKETALPYMEYVGADIPSSTRVHWRVDVADEAGASASAVSTWKQGVRAEDWRGQWIGFDEGRDAYDPTTPYYCADDFEAGENHPFLPPPVYLRKTFVLNRFSIREAVLYVSSFGAADVSLNGEDPLGACRLFATCDYRKRVYYQAFDVKKYLRQGENALQCVLADGLYAGYVGLNPRQWWGAKPRLNVQLEIEFADGERQTVLSDGTWKAAFGPWTYADVMHGAGYDATRELPGYDDSAWQAVDTGAEYDHIPMAHPGVSIVEHGRWAARWTPQENGSVRVDCERCFSGVLRVRVRGERGARLDIYHAEELLDGELYLRGNRSAEAHDRYILKGGEEEVFQPAFTYHGFRYARIDVQGEAQVLAVEAVAVSSALPEKAVFHSENETVETVYRLIENTRQSNMFDYPTDVNARDERLGWGAEGHFFMHTASRTCFNALFLRKWLRDILDGQMENGAFWATAPAVMMKDILPFAGDLQSDMGLHVCWLLLRLYEDVPTVRDSFPALERYFAFQKRNSDRLIRCAIARDWLDLAAPDGRSDTDHGRGNCPASLLGTAYFARSAQMMADIAGALGLAERAAYYQGEYGEIRRMFRVFFRERSGLLRRATQGAYLMAACFGLLEGDEMDKARAWVIEDMRARGGVTWGTATTPVALYGMRALGLEKEACEFLRSTRFPSIGYMARCGATAVWERWDAIVDGKFHPHPMNAFDHIGLATVGDWMITGLAGVSEAENGYARVRFAPAVDEQTGAASLTLETVRGRVESGWRVEKGALEFSCRVPANAVGEVELPCAQGARVAFFEGEQRVRDLCCEGGKLRFTARPGSVSLRIFPCETSGENIE